MKKKATKTKKAKITKPSPVIIDFGIPEHANGSGSYIVHLTPETTSHVMYDLTGVVAVKSKGNHTYLLKIRTELSVDALIKTVSAIPGVLTVKSQQ